MNFLEFIKTKYSVKNTSTEQNTNSESATIVRFEKKEVANSPSTDATLVNTNLKAESKTDLTAPTIITMYTDYKTILQKCKVKSLIYWI